MNWSDFNGSVTAFLKNVKDMMVQYCCKTKKIFCWCCLLRQETTEVILYM